MVVLKLDHWLGLEGEGEGEGGPVLVLVPGRRRRKRMMKRKRSRGWRGGLFVGFRVGWCRRGRCRGRWGGCFQLVYLNYGMVRRVEGKEKVDKKLFWVDLLPHHPYSYSQLHSHSHPHSHSCFWGVNRPDPLLLVAMKTGGDQG